MRPRTRFARKVMAFLAAPLGLWVGSAVAADVPDAVYVDGKFVTLDPAGTVVQAVTVDQALRMMTIWSARAQGEDAIKGSIEPGKVADLVVISDDITTVKPSAIRDIRVVETIVGGRVVYEAPGQPETATAK
jgi:predicted amidohydrolase YtcJ